MASLNLDEEEFRVVSKDQLIFNGKVDNKYRSWVTWNWGGIPCPSNEFRNVPITLLVQNPVMNPNYAWFSIKNVRFSQLESKPTTVFSYKINKWMIGNINKVKNK